MNPALTWAWWPGCRAAAPRLSDLVAAWHTPSENGWQPALTRCPLQSHPERDKPAMTVIILGTQGGIKSSSIFRAHSILIKNKKKLINFYLINFLFLIMSIFFHNPSSTFHANKDQFQNQKQSVYLYSPDKYITDNNVNAFQNCLCLFKAYEVLKLLVFAHCQIHYWCHYSIILQH